MKAELARYVDGLEVKVERTDLTKSLRFGRKVQIFDLEYDGFQIPTSYMKMVSREFGIQRTGWNLETYVWELSV